MLWKERQKYIQELKKQKEEEKVKPLKLQSASKILHYLVYKV